MQEYIYKRKEQKILNIETVFIKVKKERKKLIVKKEKKLNKSFYDPWGKVTMGIFACALSHKKAWDQALMDGVETALFLEDDVYLTIPVLENGNFTPEYKSIFDDIQQYDWDLVHLGKKTSGQSGIDVSKHLVIPKYNTNYNGAHSYIATRDMIKTMSEEYCPIRYATDIYLEQFYNTHNTFTLSKNLFKQISDNFSAENADSDTYYNEYREGGGRVGLSFDENGNVLNKKIVNYLKQPKDIIDRYVELVLDKPNFGIQKFNKPNFFGITKLLTFLSSELGENETMVELYPHFGELTFFLRKIVKLLSSTILYVLFKGLVTGLTEDFLKKLSFYYKTEFKDLRFKNS
jgi:GR25 family glycosyltransferase involved in LPS biosynthesis